MTEGLPRPEPLTDTPARRRKPWLLSSSALAWCVSLALHGGLFYAFYHMVYREAAMPRRSVVPEARLAQAGGPPMPQLTAPLRLAEPEPAEVTPEIPRPSLDDLPIAAPSDTVVEALPAAAPLAIPGAVPTAAASPAGGAGGPVSTFFGVSGTAYRIVYIVDLSMAHLAYVDQIKHEIRESVSELRPTQKFNLIVMHNREIRELAPGRLLVANAANKGRAVEFINSLRESLRADPIDAFRRAFAAQPELIYFLSDGDYYNVQEEFAAALAELNRDRSVKITVIGFAPAPSLRLEKDVQKVDPRTFLRQIATNSGGNFRIVEAQ